LTIAAATSVTGDLHRGPALAVLSMIERLPFGARSTFARAQRPPDAIVGKGVGVGQLQVAQRRHRQHGGVALEDRQ
jgi:hypothetical protein